MIFANFNNCELKSAPSAFAAGQFEPLLQWLRTHIHQAGQCYSAAQLVQRITGRPLDHRPLIEHLKSRISATEDRH